MERNHLIRPFAEQDAEQTVALWNACLPYDPITLDHQLRQLSQSPEYDPGGNLVAECSGEIVGNSWRSFPPNYRSAGFYAKIAPKHCL